MDDRKEVSWVLRRRLDKVGDELDESPSKGRIERKEKAKNSIRENQRNKSHVSGCRDASAESRQIDMERNSKSSGRCGKESFGDDVARGFAGLANCSHCTDPEGAVLPAGLKFCRQERCRPGTDTRTSDPLKISLDKCDNLFEGEKDLWKIKRSLKLLGFKLSDFGVCSAAAETGSRAKPACETPTRSTKTLARSISLVSLRDAVRNAWTDNRLDKSYRRLMAQAAYEEWYFKKEEELSKKRQQEKIRELQASTSSRRDLEKKSMKAEEEFKKWMEMKRVQRKKEENSIDIIRLTKSKEEIEKAFLKWKKNKDNELEKKRRAKKSEDKNKLEMERIKREKKVTAEKAFQQWKAKLEEAKRTEEKTLRRKKKKQDEIERQRIIEEQKNKISFQAWKTTKDEESKHKLNQIREAAQREREERLVHMEERMYEAEQAFQDWLEKVDNRNQKQLCVKHSFSKSVPWIPV